ncbi:MAG: hypothetical protein Fues2KO_54300 [Fuerstiella sp.]
MTESAEVISDEEFAQLIVQVRQGDAQAATRLVASYEPEIRRMARLRLADPEMRRLVDSMDISQSVFGRFFNHFQDPGAAVELDRPEQLLALLTKMVRNRIVDEHRKRSTAKRGGRVQRSTLDLADVQADTPGPRTDLISREQLQQARDQLTDEERWLLERRQQGDSWDDIGAAAGASPESLRKRLDRALKRVRAELDDEAAHDA